MSRVPFKYLSHANYPTLGSDLSVAYILFPYKDWVPFGYVKTWPYSSLYYSQGLGGGAVIKAVYQMSVGLKP